MSASTTSNQARAVNFLQSGTAPLSQSVQTKLRRTKELDDREDVDNTGATSILTPFTNAVADVSSGGRLIVRKGTYLFTIGSASDTILLPSGFHLDCEEGTILKWSGMGAYALMAAIEKEDVLITGAIFEWAGTLADVSGTNTDFNGWTGSIPKRDLAAHVLSLGSTGVRIKHCQTRTTGDNPSATSEFFYTGFGFHPNEDGTTETEDCAIEDCTFADVVQGVTAWGQDNFTAKNLRQRRYPGNHAVGGGDGVAGHLIYVTDNGTSTVSSNLEISDITDTGTAVGTITSRPDSTINVDGAAAFAINNVRSRRACGMFGFANAVGGVVSNCIWNPATAQSNGMTSGLSNSVGLTDTVMTGMSFILPDSTDKRAFNMVSMDRCKIDAHISASHTATSFPSVDITTSVDNKINISYLARNSTTVYPFRTLTSAHRNVITVDPIGSNQALAPTNGDGCDDNVFRLRENVIGEWTKTVMWTTEADSPAIGYEPIVKARKWVVAAPAANPTDTFQLPRAGLWLGKVELHHPNGSHLRGGLYAITWDADTLADVQLIGVQYTKGASAPSVLDLSVAATGVVTFTSTAGNGNWDFQYHFIGLGNNRYADA